jgi:hypothetical protein
VGFSWVTTFEGAAVVVVGFCGDIVIVSVPTGE